MLVRQLEEEVVKTRQHAKETNPEIKAHIEGLQLENDHLTREVAILKETIKVSPIPTICLIRLIPSKVGIITLGMWYMLLFQKEKKESKLGRSTIFG